MGEHQPFRIQNYIQRKCTRISLSYNSVMTEGMTVLTHWG